MKLQDKISQWYASNALKFNKATLEESVHKEFLSALESLEVKTLDVYYTDIVRQGAKKAWSVDLYSDEINQQCGLPWTWTIITQKMIEGTGITPRPWLIVINTCSFSLPVIESIVNTWAIEEGYKFNIRIKKKRGQTNPQPASSNSQSFYHFGSADAVFVKNEDLTPLAQILEKL